MINIERCDIKRLFVISSETARRTVAKFACRRVLSVFRAWAGSYVDSFLYFLVIFVHSSFEHFIANAASLTAVSPSSCVYNVNRLQGWSI